MYEKLLKTVTNLGSPKVLVVGDFMLDVYTYGDAERISPEAPVPVLRVTNTKFSGGGAASVTADLTDLGAEAICLGVIGLDPNGEKLKNILAESGADVSGLVSLTNRPTITKQRLIGLAQHRHQQQLFRMDEESTEPLSEPEYKKILQTYKDKLRQADIVCLQDYNKGLLNDEVCQEMIKAAQQAGKKIVVDPSFTNDYSKYSGATLVTPNRQESSLAVGFEITIAEDAAKAAKILAEELKLEAVVITLDKEGAFLKTPNISEVIPTRPRNVYDVTGAGDVVLAMLAVALAAGCDYRMAVELSNLAGGIEVEKFGVATVTIEEIINEIVSLNRGKAGKVRPAESLITELDWHRKQKEKIVFTNGCFDVVHRGHIEFLSFCKSQGDILVLGLNSDTSVRTIKGPERPINNQYDRAAVLAAMESVDYITVFDEPDPMSLIKKLKPDILIKGKDWADKGVVGQDVVESYGGKVVLADLVEGKSTTGIVEKIKMLITKPRKA